MDKQNFDAIIARYLEKFDLTNRKPAAEQFKWISINTFRTCWDLDAPDFLKMYSDSVKDFGLLIDNNYASPVSGLKTLLRKPGEVEIVREAFRGLFADDGGDIALRQQHAEEFVKTINARIEKYWPGSHKYPQSIRSAVLFLTMHAPADNYILFWSRAMNWAAFVEFADDFGSGSYFSLPKYYRMCDELRAEIEKRPDLQECNRKRQEAAHVELDDACHTLTYDIIYCATCYHLYVDIPNYGSNVSDRIRRAKDRTEIEALRASVVAAEEDFRQLPPLSAAGPALVGLSVRHAKFGEGTVAEQTEKTLKVQFSDALRSFIYPTAFTQKHLSLPQDIMESISAGEDAKKERTQKEKELAAMKAELKKKVEAFEKKWRKMIRNDIVAEDEAAD